MAKPCNGESVIRFADVDSDLLVQAGIDLGVTGKRARARLLWMLDHILEEAVALLESVEAGNVSWVSRWPIGETIAGETRCLRAIIHTVIAGMVRQLAPR